MLKAAVTSAALLVLSTGPALAQEQTDDLSALSLERLTMVQVEGAALHPQTLEDAPASVTIITADDIRKYGYRTLADALSSVRGFYETYNHSYTTVGVRGFQLPGDYASRIIVMVNGHNLADNVLGDVLYFGNDFPIEMDLIERIEIIRGPSSALYGSNGLFATVNIMTKSPEKADAFTATPSTGSFGEKKIQLSGAGALGDRASVLVAASFADRTGESPLFIRGFDTPATTHGLALGMDGERGYHVFSNVTWDHWSVVAQFSSRDKTQPISWGSTIWNDSGTTIADTRNYAEATYARGIAGNTLKWRTFYDEFRFDGHAHYPLATGDAGSAVEDNLTTFVGRWVGSQLIDRFDAPGLGSVTVGGEFKLDLTNRQRDEDVLPAPVQYLDVSRPDRSFALFAQDERKLSEQWTLDAGARLDASRYRETLVTPRVAAIYRPSTDWAYKFLYGRSFRNPSAFELFYEDDLSGLANPAARQEKADTVEIDVDRKLGRRLTLQTSAYGYRLRDFLVGERGNAGLIQYENVGHLHALGLEFEVRGQPLGWLEAGGSYTLQSSRDDAEHDALENSPAQMAKLRLAMPVGGGVDVGAGLQYASSVMSLAGAVLGSRLTADLTVSRRHVMDNLDLRVGIRNAFNAQYADPIALTPAVDALQQPGRSFFIEITARRPRRTRAE